MSYFEKYQELDAELEKVREIIKSQSNSRDKRIEEILKEILENEGKMIRPALVITSAKFGRYNPDIILNLAAAVEMLHMASLVHDDVIDDSKLRRNKETVQSKYGKDYAVYTGDYLLTRCFALVARSRKYSVVDVSTNAISNVLLSELEQLNSRYSTDVSILAYLRRIKGKTAELFISSMFIGASQSGQKKKKINLLKRIGYNLGMAFQIKDDLLDFTGSDESIGKSASNDLKLGLYTLPVLAALKNEEAKGDNRLLRILEEEITQESIKTIKSLIIENGGVKYSAELLSRYTKKAEKLIKKLPKSTYRDILLDMTKNLEIRSY